MRPMYVARQASLLYTVSRFYGNRVRLHVDIVPYDSHTNRYKSCAKLPV